MVSHIAAHFTNGSETYMVYPDSPLGLTIMTAPDANNMVPQLSAVHLGAKDFTSPSSHKLV